MSFFDPVVLFFLLGLTARLAKSDLRLPEALYEILSIYLLLAIGLKGGIEIARGASPALIWHVIAGICMGLLIPLVSFPILKRFHGLTREDAASIAAHYGSVSIVTFAVGQSVLTARGISFEGTMPVIAAVMETPGIIVGIILARLGSAQRPNWGELTHEVFAGKSMVLLLGGLLIGWLAGPKALAPIEPVFMAPFKGLLCLFLLEMGLVAGGRLQDLKRVGWPLVAFAVTAPLVFGTLGAIAGSIANLSIGGAALMGVLSASASYIAAPTAMRLAVPQANPAISIAAALGVTFPFNLAIGIPVYIAVAHAVAPWF